MTLRYFILLLASGLLLTGACKRPSSMRTSDSDAPRASAFAAPSASQLLLTGDSIGPVSASATRAALAGVAVVVRDTLELGEEAIPESLAVLVVAGDTIRAAIDGGRVYRLEINSPRFRTSDSLGVGTTLGRLLEEPRVYGLGGEGRVFVVVPRLCGLSFRLADAGGLGDAPDSVDAARLRALPLDTPVSDVLVVACRPATGSAAPT